MRARRERPAQMGVRMRVFERPEMKRSLVEGRGVTVRAEGKREEREKEGEKTH
jgi:hypothetical protein